MINLLGMLVGLSFPCLFAVLLNELSSSAFKRTTQFITFFPFFLSPIVVYSIVYSFLAVNSGLVNQVLKSTGIISTGINFMSDKAWAWPMIIGKNLWKGFGYTSVIYLASISGIDQEQYEAAEIDGAGRFARIRHITIPHLYPTITVLMILNIGALLASDFSTMYMYVNELNRPMLEVFSTYVYREGIQKLNFSYATAAGFVLSLIGLFLMLSANWFSRHFTGRAIF
jgi:putative aldouronate transport system permease protein